MCALDLTDSDSAHLFIQFQFRRGRRRGRVDSGEGGRRLCASARAVCRRHDRRRRQAILPALCQPGLEVNFQSFLVFVNIFFCENARLLSLICLSCAVLSPALFLMCHFNFDSIQIQGGGHSDVRFHPRRSGSLQVVVPGRAGDALPHRRPPTQQRWLPDIIGHCVNLYRRQNVMFSSMCSTFYC